MSQSVKFFSGGFLPQTGRVILAAGCQGLAVGRKSDPNHHVLVPLWGVPFLPRGRVPEPDRSVAAGQGQCLAVGGESDATNGVLIGAEIGLESADDFPRGYFSEHDGIARARGNEKLAVRREG